MFPVHTLLALSKVVTLAGSSKEATVDAASFLGGVAPGLNMAGLNASDFCQQQITVQFEE